MIALLQFPQFFQFPQLLLLKHIPFTYLFSRSLHTFALCVDFGGWIRGVFFGGGGVKHFVLHFNYMNSAIQISKSKRSEFTNIETHQRSFTVLC